MAPEDADILGQRAGVYLRAGKNKEATADLDKSLRLKPGQPNLLLERAAVRIREHDDAAALSDLGEADRVIDPGGDARLALATDYDSLGRQDEAIAQFTRWIAEHSNNPRLPEALNGRCWARALTNRDLDKALADCNGAVRANSRNHDFLDSRGMVFLRLSQFQKSIADYDASLAMQPKSAWSLYGRGVAKTKSGDPAGGKIDLAAAAAVNPNIASTAAKYGITP